MARTSNEFGGGEIVPAIEAITGIQAPVMADFEAVPFGTVNHEHGERRQIQNLRNNLKSSSGIERIPFNGIDELDTEQGPNGEAVHALNTGDSRIRFVGAGWRVITDSSEGTRVRTDFAADYIEITFFGTGLNILTLANSGARTIIPVVDGVTGSDIYPGTFSDALEPANRNVKINQVLPVRSGLSAGIHTIRLSQTNATSATPFNLYGVEIINENAAISQQPGADFDGRVEALSGTSFPIKPTNTTISAVNSRSGASEAFTGTTGARVLNYITSGGQFKQSFDVADEAPVVTMAGEQSYTIVINPGGSSTVTLPASTSSFQPILFGTGGTGGNTPATFFLLATGGGGGGNSLATFTRDSGNTAALTISTVFGTSDLTSVSANSTIFMTANDGTDGAESPGGPGTGGTGNATVANITSWTRSATGTNTGQNGFAIPGSGGSGPGGNVGGFGNTPLTGNEGAGGAGEFTQGTHNPGIAPGGGGSGAAGFSTAGGPGGAGRVYFEITAAAGLTFNDFGVVTGEFTAGAITGAAVGSTTAIFGNAAFDTNRLNQEVIRRINFREFGANSEFATLGDTGANKAFTLDDGTTTLVAGSIVHEATFNTIDYMSIGADTGNQSANNFTLTFVGTGLDVFYLVGGNNATRSDVRVFVDGFSIGDFDGGDNFTGIIPICSGLAYGTHTVRFQALTSSENDQGVSDFIIYGPKKPEISTLDAGSLELSDYNIMADHVDTPNSGITNLGKGLLRKIVTRETLLAGTWSLDLASSVSVGGVLVSSAVAGSDLSYTFYGTGLEFRFQGDSGESLSFYIDETDNNNPRPLALTDFVLSGSGSPTLGTVGSVTTGEITFGANTNNNVAYIIDGLPLGVHTFRCRLNTSSGNFFAKSLDIITPIHINEDNLKVGSEGLNNLTIDPVVEEDEQVALNLGEAKAWIDCNAYRKS